MGSEGGGGPSEVSNCSWIAGSGCPTGPLAGAAGPSEVDSPRRLLPLLGDEMKLKDDLRLKEGLRSLCRRFGCLGLPVGRGSPSLVVGRDPGLAGDFAAVGDDAVLLLLSLAPPPKRDEKKGAALWVVGVAAERCMSHVLF